MRLFYPCGQRTEKLLVSSHEHIGKHPIFAGINSSCKAPNLCINVFDKDSTLVRCLNGPNEPINYDGKFISKLRHSLMLQWTQIPSSGGTS